MTPAWVVLGNEHYIDGGSAQRKDVLKNLHVSITIFLLMIRRRFFMTIFFH